MVGAAVWVKAALNAFHMVAGLSTVASWLPGRSGECRRRKFVPNDTKPGWVNA
jgi:hypothetical protein